MQVTTNNHLKVCLIQPPYAMCASRADACFDFKLLSPFQSTSIQVRFLLLSMQRSVSRTMRAASISVA